MPVVKKNRIHISRPLLIFVGTLIVGSGVTPVLLERFSVAAAEKKPLENTSPAKKVEIQTLNKLAIYPQYKAPATVVSLNDSQISAEVTAVVNSVSVDVGQVVRKGELLVELNKNDYQLILKREEAELDTLRVRIDFAQYQLQRAQKLQKQQAVSEELLKQRETDLAVLQSEKRSRSLAIEQAKRNLAKCNILSPFDAVITDKLISTGELANPGTPLLRIVDAQRREVTAKLQSYQIASLRSASNWFFQDRNGSFELKLRSVLPIIDSTERTQEVRFEFSESKALSGSAGELVWQNRQAHVPAEVLVQRSGQLGIFLVTQSNRAKFVALENAAEGRPALVDVPMESKIVTKGRYQLQDGDVVTVL